MDFFRNLIESLGFSGSRQDDRNAYEDENTEDEYPDDEYEDDEEEEEEEDARPVKPFGHTKSPHSTPQPSGTDRDSGNISSFPQQPQRSAATLRQRIVSVRQIDECRDIIKCMVHGETILLNLENIDPKDCGRVVDLLSGAAYALQGRMIKIAHLSYLLAPSSVEIIDNNAYAAGNRARYQ